MSLERGRQAEREREEGWWWRSRRLLSHPTRASPPLHALVHTQKINASVTFKTITIPKVHRERERDEEERRERERERE